MNAFPPAARYPWTRARRRPESVSPPGKAAAETPAKGFLGPLLLALLLVFSQSPSAKSIAPDAGAREHPLANAIVLIIRHAEKPERGAGLSPEGEKRAKAYPEYFRKFTVDGKPLRIDYLIAAADSKESHRPRLTLEPLAAATGLKIDARFKNAQFGELAAELQRRRLGQHILICWHHGDIPALAAALGADPAKLLPGGKWSGSEYAWVLQLRFDREGRLIADETKRIEEGF